MATDDYHDWIIEHGEKLLKQHTQAKENLRSTPPFTTERDKARKEVEKIEQKIYSHAKEGLGEDLFDLLEEIFRDREYQANIP